MDLPLDILRSILLICKICDIKNICLVTKSFYSLCIERSLWLEKFNEKNLEIINNKINTVNQYIGEYKRVSYSLHTANNLVDMIINGRNRPYQSVCFFEQLFSINDLKNILTNDHPIFTKIKECDNIKEYITITIAIKETGSINYDSCEDFGNKINIVTENYYDKKYVICLINKILYYYPLIMIDDIGSIPIIISKDSIFDHDDLELDHDHYKVKINYRKEYWDECYSKYEKLYF